MTDVGFSLLLRKIGDVKVDTKEDDKVIKAMILMAICAFNRNVQFTLPVFF